jgi:broad specificity phosphatase PhoE
MVISQVHLLRHGQVDNPGHVLYGRLPGWHLSALGRQMAELAAEYLRETPLTHLRCSPLERAQETLAPVAAGRDLPVLIDERVIEADNVFAGQVFGPGYPALRRPSAWRHLLNPFRPSWGEPYRDIVSRMLAAVQEAAQAAGPSGQALIVSHQLPIWLLRLAVTGRLLLHDPRRRQCSLASLTSLTLVDGQVIKLDYAEPAAALLPHRRIGFQPGS